MFENAPKSYKDPFWSSLARQAEQEVGLPANLLQNILLKGERSNADQVSSAGARTPFQVIPETRQALLKKYNVDAYRSPEDAAKAAALLLKESLERNQGNVREAVGEYIGGTNRKNWGPVTQAYIKRVAGTEDRMSKVDELVKMYQERAPKASAQPANRVDELVKMYQSRQTERSNVLPEVVVSPDATEVMTEPPSIGESFVQGAVVDPVSAGAQLLTRALPESVVNAVNQLNNYIAQTTGLVAPIPEGGVDELVRQQQQQYEQRQGEGFDAARLAGAVLSPVNLAIAARAPVAATAAGRIATGAGLGGAAGALQPITDGNFGEQLAENVALGAVTGGALSGAGEALSRVISPRASTNPDIRALREMGVTPTPGQALGETASKVEQRLQSVPIVGGQIEARRGESLQKFSKAMFNKAGKPIGFKTDKVGFEAVQELDTAVNQAYTKAVEKTKAVAIDDDFLNSASNLSQMAAEVADNGATKKALDNQIDLILSKVTKAGKITPQTWKEFDSKLGQIARKTGNFDYKNAVRELQREWRNVAARSNPAQADLFRKADSAYSQLLTLEKAAEAASKQEGLFSPNQLYRAARSSAGSKSSVRQKTAPFMQEALAAERVLGGSVPNSGTAERLMTGGLFGGAGIAIDPTILAAPVLGGLAYSPVVSRALTGAVASRPQVAQPIAQAIQRTSPLLGLLAPQVTD